MSEAQKVTPASTKFSRPRLGFVLAYLAGCSILAGFYSQVNIHEGTQLDVGQTREYDGLYVSIGFFVLASIVCQIPAIYIYLTTTRKLLVYLGGLLLAAANLTFAIYFYVLRDPVRPMPNEHSTPWHFDSLILCYSLFVLLYLLTKSSGSRLLASSGLLDEQRRSENQGDYSLLIRKIFIFFTVISGGILACFYSQVNRFSEVVHEGEFPQPFPNLFSTLAVHASAAILLQSPVLYSYLVLMTSRAATYWGGLALFIGNLVTSGAYYIYVNRSEDLYIFNAPIVWVLIVPTSLGLIYWLTIAKKRDQQPQVNFANNESFNFSIPPPPR